MDRPDAKTYEQPSDVALMMRVRRGDELAFEALHTRYQRKLLDFFYGLARDPQLASELCQETFLRVWLVRQRYRALGSFPGYLFGIARMVWLERKRSLRKIWRLGRREELAEDALASPDRWPDACAAQGELRAQIFGALEALPEEQRIVFVMRNIRGLSLNDIASALDCPVNTVRSRKILAVKKLRHLLSPVFSSRADRVV